jgi:hypothetical protein
MTDRIIKSLVMLVLGTGLIAVAFNLLPATKLAGVSSPIQAEVIRRHTPDVPNSYSGRKLTMVRRSTEESSENIMESLNLATNEEDILNLLRGWARKDPEAALAWGCGQGEGDERSEALTDACFQIAQTDPRRAVALAEQFNLNKDAVLKNLAQQWADRDLAAAYNWIIAQPEDDRREPLVTGMAFTWSQKAPIQAAQFVMQEIPSGTAQDEAVMMVLHQWALVDFTGANTWVQQFTEGPLQDRALNELAGIAGYEQSIAQPKL